MRATSLSLVVTVLAATSFAVACGSSADDVGAASGAHSGAGPEEAPSSSGGSSSSRSSSSSSGEIPADAGPDGASSSGGEIPADAGPDGASSSGGEPGDAGADGAGDPPADAGADGGGEAPADAAPPACVETAAPVYTTNAKAEWGCPTSGASASVFSVVEPTNLTLYFDHTLLAAPDTIQLRQGCGTNSPKIANLSNGPKTDMRVLQPGQPYTLVRCSSMNPGRTRQDPASTPPNPNTSCATALPLGAEPYRQFDASKLYFTFKTASPDNAKVLTVRSGTSVDAATRMATGRFRIQVQTGCDDPATMVLDQQGTFWNHDPWMSFMLTTLQPNTTYWVVLSAIDPGLAISIRRGTSSP